MAQPCVEVGGWTRTRLRLAVRVGGPVRWLGGDAPGLSPDGLGYQLRHDGRWQGGVGGSGFDHVGVFVGEQFDDGLRRQGRVPRGDSACLRVRQTGEQCRPGRTGVPGDLAQLAACEPVYETLPGWTSASAGARHYKDLPAEARRYVSRLEEVTGVPAGIISTGSAREDTIVREDSIAAAWFARA